MTDEALGRDEFVISVDEKTIIQARVRLQRSLAPQPRQPMRVEFEYECGRRLCGL